MRAVHQWVRTHGSNLLFLYGQQDPWSAERFYLGPGTSDSATFTVAGGNHLSPYTDLPAAQQKTFVNMIQAWAGLPATGSPAATAGTAPAFTTAAFMIDDLQQDRGSYRRFVTDHRG
jgi:hypothetical protein